MLLLSSGCAKNVMLKTRSANGQCLKIPKNGLLDGLGLLFLDDNP
jgi:hypothetical protein